MKRKKFGKYVSLMIVMIIASYLNVSLTAQITSTLPENIKDSIRSKEDSNFSQQVDLIDLAYRILRKNPDSRLDSAGNKTTRLYFSVSPVVEFTIATGFSPGIAGNVAFKTSVKQ